MLYPGVFPNLAKLTADRADLVAILLTGIPTGNRPGLSELHRQRRSPTCCGSTSRSRRQSNPNVLGLLGGDAAGYPNGRRVFDDVVTIELRAIAGATYPLVNPSYKPDGAASLVSEQLTPAANRYQATFPYLGLPHDGFSTPSS